jgi:hypothetical protein
LPVTGGIEPLPPSSTKERKRILSACPPAGLSGRTWRHRVVPDATALKAIRARLCLLRVVAHPVVPFHKVPIVLGIEHGALKIRTGEFGDGFE